MKDQQNGAEWKEGNIVLIYCILFILISVGSLAIGGALSTKDVDIEEFDILIDETKIRSFESKGGDYKIDLEGTSEVNLTMIDSENFARYDADQEFEYIYHYDNKSSFLFRKNLDKGDYFLIIINVGNFNGTYELQLTHFENAYGRIATGISFCILIGSCAFISNKIRSRKHNIENIEEQTVDTTEV